MSIGYADDDIYIEQGYEIVKFKDLEFDELPKLYGYCFEDGVLEKQEVNILEETPHRYTVEHTKFNGYHARILKKDINKSMANSFCLLSMICLSTNVF